jgi:CrcB protein
MKTLLIRCLAIGLAGFFGSISRYVVGLLFGRLNLLFPLGTLFINISGSFFLGWFMTHIATRHVSDTTRLAIGVGFVGAYTTFSTFMYDSNRLDADGARLEAITNIAVSLVLGVLAVKAGIMLAKWI